MQNEKNKSVITICTSHKNYKTPLIFTMAFSGAECWCPYCGMKADMFGGENVPSTPELEERKVKYKKASSEYLHAFGVMYARYTEFNGKDIRPEDLPQEEKERLQYIREGGWKYRVEIETLIDKNI
jgi:hypothetical protein